ncbi:MAG: CARDB domain-containing protein [Myxococcota bacterium]|jgi:hypothetical protein|nr:CARDB domain-containing protein [Myxococcota bacterium]
MRRPAILLLVLCLFAAVGCDDETAVRPDAVDLDAAHLDADHLDTELEPDSKDGEQSELSDQDQDELEQQDLVELEELHDADADADAQTELDEDLSDQEDVEVCEHESCGDGCCAAHERCAYGGCIPDLGACESNDDCAGDSYCDSFSRCTPYGVPPTMTLDESCERPIEVGSFEPDLQCSWTGPDPADPTAASKNVYSAPMVADFNLDNDPSVLSPSIVITTFDSSTEGMLRILDGRSCSEQARLDSPEDRLIYASNNAIGDLDLAPDGRPEIVSVHRPNAGSGNAGLIAFRYDEASQAFVRLWYGRRCELEGEPKHLPADGISNNGPSLHDLDDDGIPEVLYNYYVYDANGCLLNPAQSYSNYLRLGVFAVLADVDLDLAPELVTAQGIFTWSVADQDWIAESYWGASDLPEGHIAVADFGDFPGAAGDAPGRAELVLAAAPASDSPNTATGTVRVLSLGGDTLFGPFELPGDGRSGRGGPPTIADFDGDGRPEFAVAGASRYTVFDLDCDIDGDTAEGCSREPGLPRGVLWSRPSQDLSSNVTGSSVFDFDADGVAEVVYADECFVRIYRGTDGEVLFSRSRSSGTGYEYPVIADVDGDFNSEIVVALTRGVSCPAQDPIFSLGTSLFESSNGIVVMRDVEDRWAASRPIWNQHAYSVTNVRDDGRIPRTSDRAINHLQPGLNNFRQNAQGSLELRGAADLTVALADVEELCAAAGGELTLAARVCNRGTNPVPDGARVVFFAGEPDAGAEIACETVLPEFLHPGSCATVSCAWTLPESEPELAKQLIVVVDPDGDVFECRDGNNRGVVAALLCSEIN